MDCEFEIFDDLVSDHLSHVLFRKPQTVLSRQKLLRIIKVKEKAKINNRAICGIRYD